MKSYKVKDGQNLLDIAMQEYGSVEALMLLIEGSNLPLSATCPAGTELVVDDERIENQAVVSYLRSRDMQVVTATTSPVLNDPNDTSTQYNPDHYKSTQFK